MIKACFKSPRFFPSGSLFSLNILYGNAKLETIPQISWSRQLSSIFLGPGLQSPEHCNSLSEGFLDQMVRYQGLNSASSLNMLYLVPRWSQRQSLNPKKWKCISGSYRAILGKRMRKSCNTSLFYKTLLDCATFLASKNKCTRKESQLPSDAHK